MTTMMAMLEDQITHRTIIVNFITSGNTNKIISDNYSTMKRELNGSPAAPTAFGDGATIPAMALTWG
jgi:hypothetical protein